MEDQEIYPRTKDMAQISRKKPVDAREHESMVVDVDKIVNRILSNFTRGRLWWPPETIPDGMQYSWQAQAVRHQPIAEFNHLELEGWSPVPPERHPGLPTRINDQVLHERPSIIKEKVDAAMLNNKLLERESFKKRNMIVGEESFSKSEINYNKGNHMPRINQQKKAGQY